LAELCFMADPSWENFWHRIWRQLKGRVRVGSSWFIYERMLKFFADFACDVGAQLLKHALNFAVSGTTFYG